LSKLNIAVRYDVSSEEAKEKVTQLLENLKEKYHTQIKDLQESWNGNEGQFSFKFSGFSISGNLIIKDSVVLFEISLPFIARMFSGKVEEIIKQEAEKVFS